MMLQEIKQPFWFPPPYPLRRGGIRCAEPVTTTPTSATSANASRAHGQRPSKASLHVSEWHGQGGQGGVLQCRGGPINNSVLRNLAHGHHFAGREDRTGAIEGPIFVAHSAVTFAKRQLFGRCEKTKNEIGTSFVRFFGDGS